MSKTLKELLKPPFVRVGRMILDSSSFPDRKLMSEVSDILYREMDRVINFTVDALNEKWERDYGEPQRWQLRNGELSGGKAYSYHKCPECGFECIQEYKYCPNCGQGLLPPEKKA